jgi:nitroreductase
MYKVAALAESSGASWKVVVEVLERHRSIRRYKPEPIPEEHVEVLMRAAQRAPTDATLHLWTAIRVRDKELRRRIADLIGQEHVFQAAEFFIFAADLYRMKRLLEHRGEKLGDVDYAYLLFAAIDAGIAAENMAVVAEAMGYGTCYIGAVQNAPGEIAELLSLPEKVYPLFGLTIGVPDEDPPLRPRLPLHMLFHVDKYRDYKQEDLELAYSVMAPYSRYRDWLRVLKRYVTPGARLEQRSKLIPEVARRLGFKI